MFTSSISWVDLVSMIVLPILLPAAIGYFTNTDKIPAFWKRLILFLLTFLTTGLTELLDHVAVGTPYDVGMAFLRAVATYLAAEGVYQGFLKQPLVKPIEVAEVKTVDPNSLTVAELKSLLPEDSYPSKATKADLIALIPEAEVAVSGEPKSIASIIQSHGVGANVG